MTTTANNSPNPSTDVISAAAHIAVAWAGWFFSNISYFVGFAALVLTCLQIYVLFRDKIFTRKQE